MRSLAFTAQSQMFIEFQCTSFRHLLFAVWLRKRNNTPDSAAQVREAVPVAVHRQVVPSHQSNFQTACHDLLKEMLELLRGRFGRRFLRYEGLITTLEFLQ